MARGVRPLPLNKTPEETRIFISQQLQQREAFYSQAKHVIDINLLDTHEKIKNSADSIIEMINNKETL
jgi:shikimate kinase